KGFKGSLRVSLEAKRNENGVVDAIFAEDIADFPDLNLAESIQRIPGVSINRMNGEGRQITVRGLGGDFNRIRINGMEAQNTSGGTDSSGGSNRGRSFDFNTFASELFTGISVRKTASASVEEGAIGATLDLRTARPFDHDEGTTLATSIQGGYNDLAEEWNPRFAGVISHRTDTFGALLSLAYSDRTILEEGFSTVRWQDGNFRSVDGVDCVASPADPACSAIDTNSLVYHPRIPRYGRLTHTQDRFGLTGSLQFRPSDKTEIVFDALLSEFDAERDEEFLEVFFRSQEGRIDVTNPTIDSSMNIVDSGTFTIDPVGNGTHPVRSEHRFDELKTDFAQYTLSLTHDFSDQLRLNVLTGSTKSEQDVPKQTTILFDAIDQVVGYSYDFRGSHRTPAIDFGSLDVTDPAQFAFTEFRDRPQFVENTFDTIAADLEFDISDTLTVSGGLSYKEFGFDTTEFRRESTAGSRLCDAGYFDCDLDNDGTDDIPGAPLTPDLVSMVSGFGSGLGMPAGNDTMWISPNVAAAASLIDIYSIPGGSRDQNIRSVTEESTGGWVQLDFTGSLGDVGVRGDVGIRYVETTTTSTGLVNGDPVTVKRDYDDTLPALNLAFEITEEFLIRTSIAEVMARPTLGDLTPGGSLDSFNGPPFEYDAGNPGLDPYRATNLDISFEWYFDDDALLAFTWFDKDVDSFFQSSESVIVPYSQSGLPVDLPPASSPLEVVLSAGGDPEVEISQTANGGDATVDGFEIIYQQAFTFLPDFWSNFGFTGNFTKVDSNEIIGFSENAYNATLYYEDETFSARVSAAYRDPYQTRSPNSSGRDERGYDSTTNVDLAMAYKLNDTMDLTLEVLNLTDEYENQLFDIADLVYVHHHTGTEYIFGFRWSPE
ncbi:MAG: TonB-dependent receptor, partial [Rhodothermales bacterium]|nr:TonB-dependent receptor [Rhodothermales bacterium]